MRQMRSGLGKAPKAAILAVMTLIMILAVLMPFTNADAEGGVSDLSLYQRASELTREFGTALAPGSGTKELHMLEVSEPTSDAYLAPGNAGAFLGYADIMADDTGIIGWLMNSYTAASATISYDQLEHVVPAKNDAVGNPFFQYAGYGEVLTDMGLAKTIRPGTDLMRILATGTVLVVYLLANAAPFLFRGALMILTTLNPFQLFGTALTGAAAADIPMISGIALYLSDIYEAVQNLSLYVLLPMMLAITIVSVLMFTKTSAMKKFSRYGVRVFMIFAGLPLIGATYTGVIEDMDAQVSVGSEYADYLILSSYVDFENWVKYSRLAPPVESKIMNPRFSPDDETRSLSDRSIVLEINGTLAANERAYTLRDRYDATSDLSKIFETGSTQKDGLKDQMSAEQKSSFSAIYSLLTRHMTAALYTSSDYNGEVSGQIQQIRMNASEKDEENIVKMFSLSSSASRTWTQTLNPLDWAEDWQKPIYWNGEDGKEDSSAKGLFTEGAALNPLFQFGTYNMNIYNTGDLRYNTKQGYVLSSPQMFTKDRKTQPIGTTRQATVGGLSPVAMYNFLNTTFSNTGLTVYSPEKSTTDISRDSYAAVTFGGSGVSAWTRWIENVTVMFSLAILSIAFGLMMISVAITSIPRILSGVFGTAFGSIAFITKLLISTAVMLIQVIGIIFLYTLSENIIMTMLLNFNSLVDKGSTYFGTGVIFQFLGSFLVIVVTASVTVLMIRNVKIFKEMMEEVVSGAINRVMGALDTGTGGNGLDLAKSTGGRIGGDGKLTDAAKAADGAGPFGLNPLTGGAVGLLGAAHDIEARREQGMQERDPNGDHGRSFGEQAAARFKTAKDLGRAKASDTAKGVAGVEGKSYERELDAKKRSIQGDYNKATPTDDPRFPNNDDDPKSAINEKGQALDADNNVVKDEFGNAMDRNGNPLSSAAALGVLPGMRPTTGKDGTLLDSEGNAFTDENGKAFMQDEKGRLVDEHGQFVALDKDGVLKPVNEIPGQGGKPVLAAREAMKLDANRTNGAAYAAMLREQNASHYGLDAEGNVLDADGNAMTAQTDDGVSAVTMDAGGFITDKNGNRIAASNLLGAVDPRGFEEVVDPESGETHLRHKGDEAMKDVPQGNAREEQSLTALAHQATVANNVAKRANDRVANLRANGASPYAIAQAERFAAKASKNANAVQQDLNQRMQATGSQPARTLRQPVTPELVASAARNAETKNASLQAEQQKLQQLKTSGAQPDVIARQANKVENERQQYRQAAQVATDTKLAQQTGRSFGEVNGARTKAERAAQVFAAAQLQHQQAVQQKAPASEMAKREQALNRASQAFSNAQADVARVSAKPAGTPAQIDQATARYDIAQQQAARASQRVQDLQRMGSPEMVQAARSRENHAERAVRDARTQRTQAEAQLNELQASGAPRLQIRDAKRNVEQAVVRAQQAQAAHGQARQEVEQVASAKPSPQEIQAARRSEQQAKRALQQAANTKRVVTSPQGWKQDGIPQIQPVPNVSPTKSYAALAAKGINSYDDYKTSVQAQADVVQQTQSQVQQATARLTSLRSTNRPRQVIEQAERQVQELRQKASASEQQLAELQSNAQGLLRNGSFAPQVVASRPIRKNGAQVANQLVNLGHTQVLVERLQQEASEGTITEQGRTQLTSLTNRLNGMRRDLVSTGIREDRLTDHASIQETTRHLQQSWDAFVKGSSEE